MELQLEHMTYSENLARSAGSHCQAGWSFGLSLATPTCAPYIATQHSRALRRSESVPRWSKEPAWSSNPMYFRTRTENSIRDFEGYLEYTMVRNTFLAGLVRFLLKRTARSIALERAVFLI